MDRGNKKSMNDLKWKKIKEEHIVQNQWIDFRKATYRLPNGKEFGPFYQYSRRSYSVIVARNVDGNFICVKQFRHGINQVTVEFPAGGIETKNNEYDKIGTEDALECAKRELLEETGYESNDWKHLITIPSNATIADNYAYCYFADQCKKVSDLHLDDTEFLEVQLFTEKQIQDLIDQQLFPQAIHVMAFLLATKFF